MANGGVFTNILPTSPQTPERRRRTSVSERWSTMNLQQHDLINSTIYSTLVFLDSGMRSEIERVFVILDKSKNGLLDEADFDMDKREEVFNLEMLTWKNIKHHCDIDKDGKVNPMEFTNYFIVSALKSNQYLASSKTDDTSFTLGHQIFELKSKFISAVDHFCKTFGDDMNKDSDHAIDMSTFMEYSLDNDGRDLVNQILNNTLKLIPDECIEKINIYFDILDTNKDEKLNADDISAGKCMKNRTLERPFILKFLALFWIDAVPDGTSTPLWLSYCRLT